MIQFGKHLLCMALVAGMAFGLNACTGQTPEPAPARDSHRVLLWKNIRPKPSLELHLYGPPTSWSGRGHLLRGDEVRSGILRGVQDGHAVRMILSLPRANSDLSDEIEITGTLSSATLPGATLAGTSLLNLENARVDLEGDEVYTQQTFNAATPLTLPARAAKSRPPGSQTLSAQADDLGCDVGSFVSTLGNHTVRVNIRDSYQGNFSGDWLVVAGDPLWHQMKGGYAEMELLLIQPGLASFWLGKSSLDVFGFTHVGTLKWTVFDPGGDEYTRPPLKQNAFLQKGSRLYSTTWEYASPPSNSVVASDACDPA